MRSTLALAFVGMMLGGGCAPAHYADPIAKMTDRKAGHSARWAAARQAEREMTDSPERLAALQQMIWQHGQASKFRIYAIQQLFVHDAEDTRAFLAKRLPVIADWETYQFVTKMAIDAGWREFTAPVVQHYVKKAPGFRDVDRPERKTLEALNPGSTVEQIIFRVFAEDADTSPVARAAAWQLLCRLTDDREALVAQLHAVTPNHALVADMQAASRELGVMADNKETLAWLQTLRTEPYAQFWQRARAATARLTPAQRRGMQLRHLPLVVHLAEKNDPMCNASRQALLDEVRRFIETQDRYLIGPSYDGPMEDHPQTLRHWRDTLWWADAATLVMLTRMMRDPSVTAQLFVMADADNRDTSTEYGGLIQWNDAGGLYPRLYTPMLRKHDHAYYAPKQLITDAYTAFAHFHFHVHNWKNRTYAGPGLGDLRRIGSTQQLTAIVLTAIDKNTMNIDYYSPGEVVVDLGVIRR